MTIGTMKRTPIERLVGRHGLIYVSRDYYLLKADAGPNRETYNVFCIRPLEDKEGKERNSVDPEELSAMLMELSHGMGNPETLEEAAKKLRLPEPLVREARRMDEGMDGFCLGFAR